MKKDQLFPSKYLKAPDLRDRDVTVTIDNVEQTKIRGDSVNIVHFEGKDKGLIINVTIFNQISKVTGEDDTDNWAGHKITLYPTETEFGGDTVDCIRVRTPKAAAAPSSTRGREPGEDDDIPNGSDDVPW